MMKRFGGLALALAAVIWAGVALAQPASGWGQVYDWKGMIVGELTVAGTHRSSAKDSTLTLTGGGAGIHAVERSDACYFVHIDRKAGDFEIIVRLKELTGGEAATAGIMVRPAGDDAANSPMAALTYSVKDNSARRMSRLAATAGLSHRGERLAAQPPVWLRMVRMGDKFAVYKSRDGRLWSMISNGSGEAITIAGPLRVGVFVAGGASDKPATAVFDSINIGDAQMRYRTSWVGNSFDSDQVGSGHHVSNTLSAMWVGPDGTCYASSYFDEAGSPCKAYRDGKVVGPLPLGMPMQSDLGGITGDGKHLYAANVAGVMQLDLDPAAKNYNPTPIMLSVNMLDKTNHSAIRGMASNTRELLVADERDHVIRVVSLESAKAIAASAPRGSRVLLNTWNTPVAAEEMHPGSAPAFAPAIVYQGQRVGNVTYTFPNLKAGETYTIRTHLAEFVTRAENAPYEQRVLTVGDAKINVAEEAGGPLVPLVKDFAHYNADAKGNVVFTYSTLTYNGWSPFGDSPGVCGIEVLDADGKRVAAVNCGGPAVGDFAGECPERIDRIFAFENPGPMVFDQRGHVWIIQRAFQGVEGRPDTKGAVKCYTVDGKFTGREMTDVTNPTALAYDEAKDQLLVAEGLPDMNVRFYSNLDKEPKLARTFGEKGGIYAGKNPGRLNDPAAGGYARFASIRGLGVDTAGNLYVGGSWQGTDVRAFAPDGKFLWEVHSLVFCNTYDVDPASDGQDIYATFNHIKLDLTKTQPGSEQTYVGHNWDWRKGYEYPTNRGGLQSIVKRLGEHNGLYMFTSFQGIIDTMRAYRYEGELAIPCVVVRPHGHHEMQLWVDRNGDGKESPDEITTLPGSFTYVTGLCVDSRGDIWFAIPANDKSIIRRFPLQGFTDKGVPVYTKYEDIPFPEEGGTVRPWAMSPRLDYDAERDIMIVYMPAEARTSDRGDECPPKYFLARYDHWSQGNRESTWKVPAISPWTEPHYYMNEVNIYKYNLYNGMQLAGDYIFFAHLFGDIHAFDAKTGKLVEIFAIGPELMGSSAWEDAAMGLRAFKRKNGEYLIFTENSGWGGKNNFIRWTPGDP